MADKPIFLTKKGAAEIGSAAPLYPRFNRVGNL